jgi:hypothetical protein
VTYTLTHKPTAYWMSSPTATPKLDRRAASAPPALGRASGRWAAELRATGIPGVPAVSRTVIHHFRQQDDFKITSFLAEMITARKYLLE